MSARSYADVIVVGAGIIGLATAYEMARVGAKVLLVEKDYPGAEQSGRNWGYTRQQYRHQAELTLAVASLARWPGLEEEFGEPTSWTRSGNLIVGDDEASADALAAWEVIGRQAGIPTQLLDGEGVSEVAPFLAGQWRAGLYTATDGHADPLTAVAAYARAARGAGCEIWTGCTATRLRTTLGAVVGVDTDRGTVLAPRVVVAGGTWSRRLLRTVGVNLPIQWVRSSVARTAPMPRIEGVVPVWAPGCAFRQGLDGRLTFAPGRASDVDAMISSIHNFGRFLPLWARNARAGFRLRIGRPLLEDVRRGRASSGRYTRGEPKVNRTNLESARQRLEELVPAARGVGVDLQWSGYIDGTPDGIPILSPVEELSGLVIAAGFSGHGFGIAPAVGEALASLALEGAPSIDLSAFRLDRFAKVRLVGMPSLN